MTSRSDRPDPVDEVGRADRVVDFAELVAGSADVGPIARLDAVDGGLGSAAPVRVADLGEAWPPPRREYRRAGTDGVGPAPRRAARSSPIPHSGPTAADDPLPDQPPEPCDRPRPRRHGPAVRDEREQPGRHEQPDPDADPDAHPESVAHAICLQLLTERARTRLELAQALRRKGVPDAAARAVLERFDDVGLIDDGAFAEQWVRSRHVHRGLGRRALAVELRRKGVADDVAAEALAGLDAAAEELRARDLVERKLRGLRADTDEQRAAAGRRLVGMLARKGYGGGVAYRVVREALAARGTEPDELASEPPPDE